MLKSHCFWYVDSVVWFTSTVVFDPISMRSDGRTRISATGRKIKQRCGPSLHSEGKHWGLGWMRKISIYCLPFFSSFFHSQSLSLSTFMLTHFQILPQTPSFSTEKASWASLIEGVQHQGLGGELTPKWRPNRVQREWPIYPYELLDWPNVPVCRTKKAVPVKSRTFWIGQKSRK